MGEKEQGLATAREAGTGRATGRLLPETSGAETDPEGAGIAIGEEGVQLAVGGAGAGAGHAAASNLNSSRSNIYRTGGSEPAPGGGEMEASNLNLSKSNINRTITGDPDFDLASVSNPPNDLGDDSGGTLAEGPAAVQKLKTKSNQSNDRLGHEDDPAGAGIAIDEPGVH